MGVKLGHKRTEVGVIPDGWSSCPLGQAGQWVSGGTPSLKNPTYWSGDIPWVSPKDMKAVRLWDAIDHISYEAVSNGAKVLPAGTILLVVRGMILAHSFPVARAERPLSTNQDVKALSTREDLDSNFVLYWLIANGQRLRGLTTESSHGTKRLPTEALFEEEIAYPPLPEQRAIATALTDVDALLTQLDRLIAKKRDIKQAAMQQLLTGKTRLPGFGEEWEPCAFDEVLERLNVKAHQLQTADYQTVGRYPVVDQGQQPVVGYSDDSKRRFLCPSGGVVVFGDHTCVVKFVDFDFLVGADGTQVLQARPGHSTRFLAYELQQEGIQQTGYNRHFKFLKDRRFKMPQLAEQTAIATLLSDLDTELATLETRRDKTHALKQGMMQELLTGRIRLA